MHGRVNPMKKKGAVCHLLPRTGGLQNQSGVVLVLVLWILTLLTVISGEFCRAMRTEARISRNFRDSTQAYYIAKGGIHLAIAHLLEHAADSSKLPKTEEADAVDAPVEGGAAWRINTENPAVSIGAGVASVRIDNEGGKVDINLAEEGLLRKLIGGFDVSEEEQNIIVDSIIDWRDEDDLHRLNGAENDYYQSLPEPYDCKNADFESIDELLKVRGVTPELFYGGLARAITVYPGRFYLEQTAKTTEGSKTSDKTFDYNRININAAPPDLLIALFGFGAETIDDIVDTRKEGDLETNEQLAEIVGVRQMAEAGNYLTFDNSPFYRIRAEGTVADSPARRVIGALVCLDPDLDEKYRIVQWIDQVRPDEPGWTNGWRR